jgi:hypothetical protein
MLAPGAGVVSAQVVSSADAVAGGVPVTLRASTIVLASAAQTWSLLANFQ